MSELPTAGDYFVKATNVYKDKSRVKGTLSIVVEGEATNLIVQTGDEEPTYMAVSDVKFRIDFYLSEGAKDISKRNLEKIGLAGNFKDGFTVLGEKDADGKLIGGFYATCKHETYDSVVRAKWELPFKSEAEAWDAQEELAMEAEFSDILGAADNVSKSDKY